MKLNSREYQCHLRPALFADAEHGLQQWMVWLAQLYSAVGCRYEPQPPVWFERILYDTPDNAFAAVDMKLRVRVYAGYRKYTHKIASHDRYSIADAPFDCPDRAAKIKFEENIHAYHAMFVKQATVIQPKDVIFTTVREWTRIFRGATGVADPRERLSACSSLFIVRWRGLWLNFNGFDARTLLDLKYADPDHTRLAKVEFSWKYREPDEAYQPDIIRLMRQFYQMIHQSAWIDSTVDLAKCQRDAGLGS